MDFMHRITGELRESADPIHHLKPEHVQTQANGLKVTSLLKTEITQDVIQDDWILNPDLSEVRNPNRTAKLPSRYWKIPQGKDNKVTAMTQPERDAVDATLNPPDPDKDLIAALEAKDHRAWTTNELRDGLRAAFRLLKKRGSI